MWNTDSGIPVFYYPHKSISAYPNMATKYLTATNFNPRPKFKKNCFVLRDQLMKIVATKLFFTIKSEQKNNSSIILLCFCVN